MYKFKSVLLKSGFVRSVAGTQFAYALWFVTGAVVVIASLQPRTSGEHFGAAFDRFDKFEHLAAYIALGLTSKLPYRCRTSGLRAAFAMLVAGALLEYLQSFVPGRTCDARDMLANIAGLTIGHAAASLLQRLDACAGADSAE